MKYKVTVKSKLYETDYIIEACNLREASNKAKEKFLNGFQVSQEQLKVSLQTIDIKNHIDEILQCLYN